MIPFSFPFSSKMITLKIGNNLVSVDFQTSKRDEIIKQYFPQLPFEVYINKRKLPNSQAEVSKWIDNDRFGQLNYMYATYYFFVTEQNIDDIKKAMDDKYLLLCADIINRISKAYRLLVNHYFPRNFTKNDFMGYLIAFSIDKNNFFGEEFHPNVVLHQGYPDEELRIDINDFLKYEQDIWLHTELIINAEDFLMEKNYRMCVIEANTAVETILFNVVEKHYNTFPPDIQKEVSLNDLPKQRIDDLKKYLKLISSKITRGKKWSDWKSKCQDLRNNVVHKRKKPDINETDKALSSAKELIEFLKEFLYDEKEWILEATAFINDRKKAKDYLEKSITVKPHPDAYYYLGNIECEAKNYRVAIQHYKKGLVLFKHPFFYFHMGKCYEDQGLYEEAVKQYDEAISEIEQSDKAKRKFLLRHPHNNPYYQKYLIITKQKLDFKPSDIINLFNGLLEVFPSNTEFLTLRAKYM